MQIKLENNLSRFVRMSLLQKLPVISVAFFFAFIYPIQAQETGDAFVTGSISDARTLMPLLASDSTSAEICGMLFNGLVKYNKDIVLTGDLAESWEIRNDGQSIIFHLRHDVQWHDGQPFTADDVAFTYQKLIDPKVRTAYSGDFERVEKLEILDSYTIKVTYKEPFAPALSSWSMSMLPKHILEKLDLNTAEFARHPIGTGPYRFKSWATQEKIELEANPAYFEKRPYIDRYIHRVIADESTIFLELQTQGLDSAGLTPLQFTRQTDTPVFKNNYQKYQLPSFTYIYLGYNLQSPLFQDVRVREALNYAVDKDEIIKILLLGYGKQATGPFIPDSWAYNQNIKPVPFDPQHAKELLREAGWSDYNSDKWLEKDGLKFEFTITTNQGNQERIDAAQIIQRRLKEIGIKVRIKVLEWSVFIDQCINKRNFDAVLLGWSLPREPDNFDIWHSSKTKEGEFNFIGYKNTEVDFLLEEARSTFNLTKRAACYQRIQEILYAEQPYMFLYIPDSLSVLHKRFRGIKPAPIGIGYNFIEWWVPKEEQRYNKPVIQQ
ncbi:MAG TPA: peptide-binding protein [Candidatus Omnitrophota bacterium]|nr:peptide-binding protein [Candidatus Omnitrophota bacterium]